MCKHVFRHPFNFLPCSSQPSACSIFRAGPGESGSAEVEFGAWKRKNRGGDKLEREVSKYFFLKFVSSEHIASSRKMKPLPLAGKKKRITET